MSSWNFQHFDTQSDFGVVDENGITHRTRKKPGRKANPAASAQRKAQNRAAQRAFRERKQKEKKDTDAEMRRTTHEINQLRRTVKELRFENKQLKAMVISYILTCFEMNSAHPRVHALSIYGKPVQEDMPALLNIFLDENSQIVDLETAALNLVDADSPYPPCTAPSRNLKHEKKLHRLFDDTLVLDDAQPCPARANDTPSTSDSLMGTNYDHFSNCTTASSPDTNFTLSTSSADGVPPLPHPCVDMDMAQTLQMADNPMIPPPFVQTNENTPSPGIQRFCQSNQMPSNITENFVMLATNRQIVQDQWNAVIEGQDKYINFPPNTWATDDGVLGNNPEYSYPPMHPIQAVQLLRLQMKIGNILGADKDILNPTDLQQAIVHDRRIDYIPGPGMRDRMILFRDHYDADDCFNLLASQSIFLGGEVTNPSNWALPERFYNKYWFLCANQDLQNAEKVESMAYYRHRIFSKVREKRAQMHGQGGLYGSVDDILAATNLSNLGVREYLSCI